MKKKLLIAASPGGHLQEILNLTSLFDRYEIVFVTFYTPALEKFGIKNNVYFVKDASRGLINLLRNTISSFIIINGEKPDLVLSTGAGVALPSLIFSRIFGIPVIYFELKCQVSRLTKTGRFIRFFANYFFVQDRGLSKKYGVEYASSLDNLIAVDA
jgi:UDP-N-acetylglucosamine:LPS N-acetylglucosamine transferase